MDREIRKMLPALEKRIAYRVIKEVSEFLQEEFYPPEFMFREEFLKEIREAKIEAKKEKLLSWKELQKSWKKKHGKI